WTHVRWLDPESSFMRVIAIYIMMLVTQLAELNTFFLKYIFNYPINHWIGIIRILIICAIVAPTIRQYYTYVTDPMCKRVGTQLWVFTAITVLEFIISIKHGQHVFSQTIFTNVILWLLVQMGMVLICLYILWFFFTKQSKKTAVGRLRNEPMDKNPTAPRKIISTRAHQPEHSLGDEETQGCNEQPYKQRLGQIHSGLMKQKIVIK
ncbi:putative phosphatidylserine synthase 1, partial [Apostichopus japonicus]